MCTVHQEQKKVPSISLCICTMNRPSELDRCLTSIFKGLEEPDEIIVSDDSLDPAPTRLVAEKYPKVIYCHGPCRGLGANRNACIQKARASHLVFVDDDVCVPVDFIAKIRELIKESNLKTIITGYEVNYSMQNDTGEAGRKVVPKNADFWGNQKLPIDENNSRGIVINSTIFPGTLFEKALFDERLYYGCDELDIARHSIALDYKIIYNDNLYVNHFPSTTNRQKYEKFVHTSRIYSTAKAYLIYERLTLKAILFMILAPLQLLGSEIKRGRLPMREVFQTTILAYYYTWTCFRYR